MKTKVLKILFVFLLLLLSPAISSTYNVHAQGDYILVSRSEMDLSPEFLIDSRNLNSPEMKRYLIRCIEFSEVLPKRKIEQIKEELDNALFFCLRPQLYDDFGSAILHIWISSNIMDPRIPGELISFPMRYE